MTLPLPDYLHTGRTYGAFDMISDPIVEEVRARSQEHAARCNYDLKKIALDVRKNRERLNWPVAKPKRKRRAAP